MSDEAIRRAITEQRRAGATPEQVALKALQQIATEGDLNHYLSCLRCSCGHPRSSHDCGGGGWCIVDDECQCIEFDLSNEDEAPEPFVQRMLASVKDQAVYYARKDRWEGVEALHDLCAAARWPAGVQAVFECKEDFHD